MWVAPGAALDFDDQIDAAALPAFGWATTSQANGGAESGDAIDVTALPLPPDDEDLRAATVAEARRWGIDLDQTLATLQAAGKVGECLLVPAVEGERLLALVGVGSASADDVRRAGATLAHRLTRSGAAAAAEVAVHPSLWALGLEPFAIGLALGCYDLHARSDGAAARPPARVVLLRDSDPDADTDSDTDSDPDADTDSDDEATLERALVLARASWAARALSAVPSNVKTPAWLAGQAERLAAAAGLSCTVVEEKALARRGFGGILGVGQGSANPPRLVTLEHRPRRARGHVVLVGKGITFDSGGLSIKTAEGMATMKRDMTGGAVVIATLTALARLGCPIRVTGLVCMAENSVGAASIRPGDVIRHYGGRTTEVTNTDAEGRLVMADALAHAVADLSPDAVVDVATLTGAVKVSLGRTIGGLFANDEALAAALGSAGDEAGEPLWRLPLTADYEDRIASEVADSDNAGGAPGAITAALFLQHFVGRVPWAHLDIASVGDAPSRRYEWSEGPTGFGVRALATWLTRPEPLAGVGG